MRTAPAVTLSIADRSELERLSSGCDLRLGIRALIIQLAAEGRSDKEIGAMVGVAPKSAARWRRRFLATGIAGIKNERSKPGRPPSISPDQLQQILARSGNKQWSTRMVARLAGVSAATVRRIWKLRAAREAPTA
jgi:transposase